MNTLEIFDKTYAIPADPPRIIALLHDQIDALKAENATLRETLIDVTGQRNVLQQELHKALQESGVL